MQKESFLLLRQKAGLSLSELLVTVVLIGILATLTLVAINPGRYLARGRDDNRRGDLEKVRAALEEYYFDSKAYPTDGDPDVPREDYNNLAGVLVPSYLASLPKDLKDSDAYHYEYDADDITIQKCFQLSAAKEAEVGAIYVCGGSQKCQVANFPAGCGMGITLTPPPP